MWYSTANRAHRVSFRTAVLQGLAPEQGLYMPEVVPMLPASFFAQAAELSFQEQAFEIARAFLADDIPDGTLRAIVEKTLTFDVPLVPLEPNVLALELFHGPTLAFKDVGARFMSQLLGHYSQEIEKEIVVVVATSGDTGGAVANGFYRVPGVRVVVLYPAGKVSELQEKQFTTLGHNITALEVDGTFDDCQRLVKAAFSDRELTDRYFLTSANSINVGRLLPQIFYYVYAWSRAPKNRPVVFSVPSGNFGNLMAGLFAQRMGLPNVRFIAATNKNDVVPSYLQRGIFEPRSSVTTISNAMDVGNPSNFIRILDLFDHDYERLKQHVTGFAFSDAETEAAMKQVYQTKKYCLDPHGAVGYLGLKSGLRENEVGIVLETAHPAKFLEVVEHVLEINLPLPDALQHFAGRQKTSVACGAELASVKQAISDALAG
jgi:threonine synthase